MKGKTVRKVKANLYWFIVFLVVAMMIVVAFGPSVSGSKAPAPVRTAVSLLGANEVYAAGNVVNSKDECDESGNECCEDDGEATDHKEYCTPTPVPQPSIAPSNTPVPTATPVNTPTPRSTPRVVPTNSPTRTPAPTNTPTQVPLPTMPATATPTLTKVPTNTPAPTNTPSPTRTPLPVKPTSTPHGMVKTPVPTVVSSTACTCQQIMTLTWDEKADGNMWLIARFKELRAKGVCININLDPPANADWINEANQTIDSLYLLYK